MKNTILRYSKTFPETLKEWVSLLRKMEKDHLVELDHKDCGEIADILEKTLLKQRGEPMRECQFCGRGQKERVEESGERGDEEYTISFMPAPGTYTPVSFKVCNSCYCSTYNLIAKKYHKHRLTRTMTEIKLPEAVKERKEEEKADPRQRFFGVYPNLPLNERGNVCAVVNGDEPVSWKIAKLEIEHDTKIGEEILAQLVRMDLI